MLRYADERSLLSLISDVVATRKGVVRLSRVEMMIGCAERNLGTPDHRMNGVRGSLLGTEDLDVALAVAGDVAAVSAADGDLGGEIGIEGAALHREITPIHLAT